VKRELEVHVLLMSFVVGFGSSPSDVVSSSDPVPLLFPSSLFMLVVFGVENVLSFAETQDAMFPWSRFSEPSFDFSLSRGFFPVPFFLQERSSFEFRPMTFSLFFFPFDRFLFEKEGPVMAAGFISDLHDLFSRQTFSSISSVLPLPHSPPVPPTTGAPS